MTAPDPRLTPARPDLAAEHLRGLVTAERFVTGQAARVVRPVAALLGRPGGRQVSELLYGEGFEVYERKDGLAWGQATRDGYVGWVEAGALGNPVPPRFRVIVPLTHLYPAAEVKDRPLSCLPFGADLGDGVAEGAFLRVAEGFVPLSHVAPLPVRLPDAVAVAEAFLGAPYLWGGRSWLGIDCSGLVQLALEATGRPCPRDSDQQAATGTALSGEDALQRGDLVFWKGHVGLMQDATRLLHANGHHMQVVSEPLAGAIARIAAKGSGPVTARRRPDPATGGCAATG